MNDDAKRDDKKVDEQIVELVERYGQAMFDCGDWREGESGVRYHAVYKEAEAAGKALLASLTPSAEGPSKADAEAVAADMHGAWQREKSRAGRFHALLVESRRWQAEGEYGDPLGPDCWTKEYADYMKRLDAAIADIPVTPSNVAPLTEREAEIHRNDCPRLREFFDRYALGPKQSPSCLVCGSIVMQWPPAIQHAELPGIVVCHRCRDAAASATPSAMGTGTDEYKEKYLLLSKQHVREVEALQARIDTLMMEHCPDEMTPEQIENWKEHQVPMDSRNDNG